MGLIHDVGKYMLTYGEPQFACGGDIYPVGCQRKHPPNMEYPTFFEFSPEYSHPIYSTELGIYEKGCGLEKLHFSWGHDEYLYMILSQNETKLPPEALYIARYHSFWYHHFGGQYEYFLNDYDREMLKWLCAFRKADLYSKDPDFDPSSVETLKLYYRGLVEKYFPTPLRI